MIQSPGALAGHKLAGDKDEHGHEQVMSTSEVAPTETWSEVSVTSEASVENDTERVSWWIKAFNKIQKLG